MQKIMPRTNRKSESVTFRIDSKTLKNLRREAEQAAVLTYLLMCIT
jgi:hypothetical protein